MGTPNSTSVAIDTDIRDLIVKGKRLSDKRLIETGLDVDYLEEKMELLKPHLAYIGGFKRLDEQWVQGVELEPDWNSILHATWKEWQCARLFHHGLQLYKGGQVMPVVVLVFLTRGRDWLTTVSTRKQRFGTFVLSHFQYHLDVREMCAWLTSFIAENSYEAFGDRGEPPAVAIGRALDLLLDNSITEKENRVAVQKRLRETSNAVNLRYFGVPRPS